MTSVESDPPSHTNPTIADLYCSGYRAKRTGKHIGKVRDSDGVIHRVNVYSGRCSCQLGSTISDSLCIHVLRFTALLCYQRGVRQAKQEAAEEVTAIRPSQTTDSK